MASNKQRNELPNYKKYQRTTKHGVASGVLPGVNLTKLASDVGVNRSHLSKVLNGHGKAGYVMVTGLRRALGFSTVEQVERWLVRVARPRVESK